MSKLVKIIIGLFTGVFIFMMYLPFVVMFVLSFNAPTGGTTFPLQGLSLYWYKRLLGIPVDLVYTAEAGTMQASFGEALLRSVVLAIMTLCISVLLGTLAAQAFRKPFKGSGPMFYLFLLGIITPGVSVGLGLALFYQQLGLTLSWFSTTLTAHILWTLPFSFMIMLIMFNRFDQTIEEAARLLGANEWVTFRTITLPLMLPGIMSSALFSFTLSFDEFTRSLFVTGNDNTLPIMVLSSLTVRITPKLYALGSITTLISFALIISYLAYIARSRLRRNSAAV